MSKILINKIKNALNSTKPIDAVKEVVAEYDEIIRLAAWRDSVLISGKCIKKHQAELDSVVELLEQYGYYSDIHGSDNDKEIRDYFKKM